jgi:hypothetical protein
MQIRKRHQARKSARVMSALGMTAAVVTGGVLGAAGSAHASPTPSYSFTTLDNSNDLTFNQLLGINDHGVIAGYFGSGQAGHPNKGYYLLPGDQRPRYNQLDYRVENFPGSTQTQVTGLNDGSTQVGFDSPTNTGTDANLAWYSTDDGLTFHSVTVPADTTPSSPAVTQLLGVNDHNQAVGFYNDAAGLSHGFTYSIRTGSFSYTTIPGTDPATTSVTDAAINNWGQIAGFFTASGENTESFLTTRHGVITLSVPGASSTVALGVNDFGEVVGVFTNSSGTHGFTWTRHGGFTTIDDNASNAMPGTTNVNGVNDRGQLVGFYTDTAGNVDGMLVTPSY